MSLQLELLAALREVDLKREARASRLKKLVSYCRRRILGLLPAGRACEPCTAA